MTPMTGMCHLRFDQISGTGNTKSDPQSKPRPLMAVMSPCNSPIVTKVPLWWGMFMAGWGSVRVLGAERGTWELSVPSPQFFLECKTALKKKWTKGPLRPAVWGSESSGVTELWGAPRPALF